MERKVTPQRARDVHAEISFDHSDYQQPFTRGPTDGNILSKRLNAGRVYRGYFYRTKTRLLQSGITSLKLKNLTLAGLKPVLTEYVVGHDAIRLLTRGSFDRNALDSSVSSDSREVQTNGVVPLGLPFLRNEISVFANSTVSLCGANSHAVKEQVFVA